MKKLFFLFLLPLWGLGGFAHATVTVTPLSVNYNTNTVTFSVVYANAVNNRAWVWIDLCPVPGGTPGTFQPAEISAASAPVGSVLYASSNTRGFFVTASPATVTATLDNAVGKFNWCAYGSDAPPKAETLPDGGYKLYGTPPFTINGNLTENTKGFGAGTCIASITDLTGNPDGITSLPTLSSPNSPSRCSAGAVTLSVTRSGGTTTAMTYTWNIGGTTYTNTTNSYTTGSLSSSRTYSVKVKNANNCESNTVNGSITINTVPAAPTGASNNSRCGTGSVTFSASPPAGCTIDWYNASANGTTVATGTTSYSPSLSTTTTYYAQSRNTTTGCTSASRLTVSATITQPGNNGQSATSCGCASGTTNCNGTCKTNSSYTSQTGVCSGTCNKAWLALYDQCGLVSSQYSTYTLSSCTAGCSVCPGMTAAGSSSGMTPYLNGCAQGTVAMEQLCCCESCQLQGYTLYYGERGYWPEFGGNYLVTKCWCK